VKNLHPGPAGNVTVRTRGLRAGTSAGGGGV